MLFLLNDAVFDIGPDQRVSAVDERRFATLGFDYIVELGCELFAESPLLHRDDPERARRLAYLIASRETGVNAALFASPEVGCSPELVEPRFAVLPQQIIGQLRDLYANGSLDLLTADKTVWGRLAA